MLLPLTVKIFNEFNTNALDIFTLIRIAPHPIPLPSRGEGRVRRPHVKRLNSFVLVRSPCLTLVKGSQRGFAEFF